MEQHFMGELLPLFRLGGYIFGFAACAGLVYALTSHTYGLVLDLSLAFLMSAVFMFLWPITGTGITTRFTLGAVLLGLLGVWLIGLFWYARYPASVQRTHFTTRLAFAVGIKQLVWEGEYRFPSKAGFGIHKPTGLGGVSRRRVR